MSPVPGGASGMPEQTWRGAFAGSVGRQVWVRVWDSFGCQAGIGSTRLCSACCPMEASLPVHHRSGVSVGGGRRFFHPMGCPLAGLQRQLSPVHIQGTVAGDVAQLCWCHLRSGPQGCLWHSAGCPGSGSRPHGPLPQGCNDRPRHSSHGNPGKA